MNTSQKRPFDETRAFDHGQLIESIQRLSEKYPLLEIGYLGKSILGRSIPLLRLGHGKREVLYVGAHHGMEWITSSVLMRFVSEYCEQLQQNRPLYHISLPDLSRSHTIYIIPMLNPDGVEYQIHGIEESNPLFPRLLTMNGGSMDFSTWQANARGVDLNHNYDAEFVAYKRLEAENGICGGAPTRYSGEFPESEPEVAALCNFIRFHEGLRGVLTFHTQGEEIFYQSGGKAPRGSTILARRIAMLTGYCLSEAEGLASYGGLTDWCVQKQDLPSFTIECGKGKNPLPIKDYFSIYARLREMLFTLPILF